MQGFESIISAILMLFIMIAMGYACEKTGYVSGIRTVAARLVTRVTLPLLVVVTISRQELSPDTLRNILLVMGISVASILILIGISRITSRLQGLDAVMTTLNMCATSFGNVIFLGYPVIHALFGDEGVFYAAFYALVNDTFLMTLGVYQLRRGEGRGNAKSLINPNTISIAVALILLFCKISLPEILAETFEKVGACTTPLSMLFIGATLAGVSFKGILKCYPSFTAVLIKMLMAPAALMFALIAANNAGLGLPLMIVAVLVLEVAMPSQTVVAILAQEYGVHSDFPTEHIFVSTLISMVSLPAVFWMIGMFIRL